MQFVDDKVVDRPHSHMVNNEPAATFIKCAEIYLIN